MTIARREFLTGLAAAGATTAFGYRPALTEQAATSAPAAQATVPLERGNYSKPVIDLHFHWYPKEFMDLLEKEGAVNGALVSKTKDGVLVVRTPVYKRGFDGEEVIIKPTPSAGGGGGEGGSSRFGDPLKTDVAAMIKDMDGADIDAEVCNQTNPHVLWAPPAFGLKLAQAINDGTSRLCQQYPTRIYGAISLPQQDVKLSLQELERASKLPGMRAVNVIENTRGKNPGDESFWPLWARCEQLGLPLFFKNVDTVSERMTDPGASQMNMISNPFEATIAATSMMLSGALDEFPKLEVYMPHAGGFYAFVMPRADRNMRNNTGRGKMKGKPTDYVRRFHYDLILHSPKISRMMIDLVGADRIACGTDRPQTMAIFKPVEYVESIPNITRREAEMILCENPARLLKL
jgi:aminocarboxymuconate-semialdehyde decarboxylase